MRCSISDVDAVNPVFGTTTGLIYEKSTIEKALNASGEEKCPVSGSPLKLSDLIPIKSLSVSQPPRSLDCASIPSLLQSFQNEWDALVLESFELKQRLAKTRRELSMALYEKDAAMRLISRLIKERDEARTMASTSLAPPTSSTKRQKKMDIVPLDEEEIEKLSKEEASLQQIRNTKRKQYQQQGSSGGEELIWKQESIGLNKISCMDGNEELLVVSNLKSIQILDASGKSLSEIEKSMSCIKLNNHILMGFSNNSTKLELFALSSNSSSWIDFDSPLTTCAKHTESGEYGFALEESGQWNFFRLATSQIASVGGNSSGQNKNTCIAPHPDGKLFATCGLESEAILIWDIRGQGDKIVGSIQSSQASLLQFSENGVSFASVSNGVVSTWDMRKTTTPIQTFGEQVTCIGFDLVNGQRFATGNANGNISIRQFATKGTWPVVFDSSSSSSITSLIYRSASLFSLDTNGVVNEWKTR